MSDVERIDTKSHFGWMTYMPRKGIVVNDTGVG